MQPTQLYLDTARLGQMSPRAQQVQFDFSRLAGEEGGSLLFERFLQEGTDAWPSGLRDRFPALSCWHGVTPLKQNLRSLAGSNPLLPVLVANRLSELMRFAARLLFQPCSNVLVTDLGWMPYHEILGTEARRMGRHVTTAAVRPIINDPKAREEDVVEEIRRQFRDQGCDGLFLTAVSHLGVRLPVERLVRTLEHVCEPRFVVIDGAQDFCHASADLRNEYCDLYLAGCHKWLKGFHPLGLGFYGRQRSRAMIETLLATLLAIGGLDDPLLRFTTQLESAKLDGHTETVNLLPLFTCQGAADDVLEQGMPVAAHLAVRRKNLVVAAEAAKPCGWNPLLPASPFQTGILLLQAQRESLRNATAPQLRKAFAGNGIALTAYDGGVVRLSMPTAEWQPDEIHHLQSALQAVA
jgi:selenocysteine lyase/cysteine desulfurase